MNIERTFDIVYNGANKIKDEEMQDSVIKEVDQLYSEYVNGLGHKIIEQQIQIDIQRIKGKIDVVLNKK